MLRFDLLDRLLTGYRCWGLAAVGSFLLFCTALYLAHNSFDGMITLFMLLISGFAWIGTTSISRHSLILIKNYIGKRVSAMEFLSTQLVFLLFPYSYYRVKKEIESFKEKS